MIFRCDPHLHSGPCPWSDERHGDTPESMAEGIVRANLDVYAITNHNGFYEEDALVEEEVERLLDGTGRQILRITGAEIAFDFEGRRFHANHLCRNKFQRGRTLTIPGNACTFDEIMSLRKAYPGVTILNHPIRRPGHVRNSYFDHVRDLVDTGEFEGIEVVNGAISLNAVRHRTPSTGLIKGPIQLFQQIRDNGIKIAAIGGGDAHRGFNRIPLSKGQPEDLQGLNAYDSDNQVGSAITEFCAETPKGLFEEIRMGRTCAVAVHREIRNYVRSAIDGLSLNGLRRYVRAQSQGT